MLTVSKRKRTANISKSIDDTLLAPITKTLILFLISTAHHRVADVVVPGCVALSGWC